MSRLTQLCPHTVSDGSLQVVAHAPLEQTWPDEHAEPQVPQLLPSESRSTQFPIPHSVKPRLHTGMTAPPVAPDPVALAPPTF